MEDASSTPTLTVTMPDDLRTRRLEIERRALQRPAFSDEEKQAATSKAHGICECTNQNCWHYHRCKTKGDSFVPRPPHAITDAPACALFCRGCAKAARPTGSYSNTL